ncbi:MAG: hypothetical protein D6803_04150 [Anaerolineae bacterium]|nr:MAG: hypothetical protein D6803_04150 [Anaerolineae bacterium]
MRVRLVTIPLLALLVVFESAVLSRMPLLHGTADVVLLFIIAWSLQERVQTAWPENLAGGMMMGFISAYNVLIPLLAYLAVGALARYARRRVWQLTIVMMFALTFIGTLLLHSLAAATRIVGGTPLPLGEAFRVVTLPALVLNLLLAAPVYALVRDLADWLLPEEVEI